ncbi:glucose 1-dehydrogenase [Planosporangium thailandense]|uniref:Glucose 1-dehydrogenase n=1 Tax=Planosporangium thailandense TaxID=765197 RepID=A0ABX0Y4U8_9ACTN|nr:glucose 1-dehydrogenase [Planosporangium thailandense]NJC73431.1 glucose 1-dehydrogenase [Planosporangium thailandense]
MRLQGKVCLVTGGSSGIGLAISELFAAEGAALAVLSVDGEQLTAACKQLTADGHEALAIHGDVSREADWAAAVEQTLAAYGRIDVLVNNAGYGVRGTVLDTDPQAWNDMFATNVNGVYLGSRAVLPVMCRNGSGSIVNVASVAGAIGMSQRAGYCATKAAVIGLTRAMAIDHADAGVRVNAVAPGTTDSPYFDKISPDVADRAAFRKQLAERQVLRRMGTPAEIAAAALFLASDESSFATGSVVTVDGGMSIW